jgi:hypothetical protein
VNQSEAIELLAKWVDCCPGDDSHFHARQEYLRLLAGNVRAVEHVMAGRGAGCNEVVGYAIALTHATIAALETEGQP